MYAQRHITMYHMENVAQRNYANPALLPQSKINISFPGYSALYFGFYNTGFKWSDVLARRADDSLVINKDHLLSVLKPDNYLGVVVQNDWLALGIKFQKNYFSFNVTEKAAFRFRYPRDFADFVLNGNGSDALIGKELKFNFGLDATIYREIAVGYTRTIGEKLNVGGRAKFLKGIFNVQTAKSDISLHTAADDFSLTARSNILINTSGILDSSDNFNKNIEYTTGSRSNNGFAFDLGAAYQLTEKINISASVVDVGFISWKSEVTNFKSTNEDATFTFSGLEVNNLFSKDSTSGSKSGVDKIIDSLKTKFDLETQHNSYRTSLSSQFYLGATYALLPKHKVGILFTGYYFNSELHPATTLSYNMRVGRWLNLAANYSIMNRSYNNVGLGLAFNAGPAQWQFITDNVLGIVKPQDMKQFNLRMGFTITLGREKKEKKAEEPKKE